MDDKNKGILKKDKELIYDLVDFLLKVVNPETEDFLKCISKINRLEKDTIILLKLEYIDTLSLIKRLFQYIDKNKNAYYECKYILFTTLSKLEKIYSMHIEGENIKKLKKLEEELLVYQKEMQNLIEEKNKNKRYYYIKIELDTKVPYFYLTRKTIILNLAKYGKLYNYTPSSLDDDVYNYFIFDYKVDKDVNVEEIFFNLKKIDDAIIDYSIFKIESRNNLYNLKFYIKEEVNSYSCLLMNNLKFIDKIHYDNYYDTYVESKNQRYLLEDLFKIDEKDINLIAIKKINEREVKILLPNGLTSDNIVEVKNNIRDILIDKNISEIIYCKSIDFKGYQMLEYLNERYKIEYTSICM